MPILNNLINRYTVPVYKPTPSAFCNDVITYNNSCNNTYTEINAVDDHYIKTLLDQTTSAISSNYTAMMSAYTRSVAINETKIKAQFYRSIQAWATDVTYNITADEHATTSCTYCIDGEIEPPSLVDHMRELIRSRMAPAIHIANKGLRPTTNPTEIRARQTLRRLIGEVAFQRYLARGFHVVKGESGRNYQIFPGHEMVRVWENGEQLERLCVVLSGAFPPTDSVLMRMLLIQDSEERFRGKANVNRPNYFNIPSPTLPEPKSLPELFKFYKAA